LSTRPSTRFENKNWLSNQRNYDTTIMKNPKIDNTAVPYKYPKRYKKVGLDKSFLCNTGCERLKLAFNSCAQYGLSRYKHILTILGVPLDVYYSMQILLTYLCGTTINIWLRPVQEDLSMPACLEHSASNLWPLGPGYRYADHDQQNNQE
jgi:hypothetical protein